MLYTAITILIGIKWFVDDKVLHAALNGELINDEYWIECIPEKVPNAQLDENLNVLLAHKHYTVDGRR